MSTTSNNPPINSAASGQDDPRILYAAERTYLAWVRTGLALMGFGFVVARFGLFLRELMAAKSGEEPAQHPRLSLWVGTALVLLGVLVHVAAALRHREIVRRLRPPMAADRRWSAGAVMMGILLAFIGLLLAAYLIYAR